MKALTYILAIVVLMGCASKQEATTSTGEDYWTETDTTQTVQEAQEMPCYCPAQEGQSFTSHAGDAFISIGRDLFRFGRGQVVQQGVGALQGVTPAETQILTNTATAVFVSPQIGKASNRSEQWLNKTRYKDPAMNAAACQCDNCPYHGTRYKD
jgi:hypothetical protein